MLQRRQQLFKGRWHATDLVRVGVRVRVRVRGGVKVRVRHAADHNCSRSRAGPCARRRGLSPPPGRLGAQPHL
eukprot:scaffold40206_cov33-Phaeocystis_antarctica.AAC.1